MEARVSDAAAHAPAVDKEEDRKEEDRTEEETAGDRKEEVAVEMGEVTTGRARGGTRRRASLDASAGDESRVPFVMDQFSDFAVQKPPPFKFVGKGPFLLLAASLIVLNTLQGEYHSGGHGVGVWVGACVAFTLLFPCVVDWTRSSPPHRLLHPNGRVFFKPWFMSASAGHEEDSHVVWAWLFAIVSAWAQLVPKSAMRMDDPSDFVEYLFTSGDASDADQAVWAAAVEEHARSAWPNLPHEEVCLSNGACAYMDAVIEERTMNTFIWSNAFVVDNMVGFGCAIVVLTRMWTPSVAWSDAAIASTARRLFDDKFYGLFLAIEASTKKINRSPSQIGLRVYAQFVALFVIVALFADMLTSTRHGIMLDLTMDSLAEHGRSEYPGPFFTYMFMDAGVFVQTLLCFILLPAGVAWCVARYGFIPTFANEQANWMRLHLLGQAIDCDDADRHLQILNVAPGDEELGRLLNPVVSVARSGELSQWHQLRTFLLSTVIDRDHQLSSWYVIYTAVVGVGSIAYLLFTSVWVNRIGLDLWGFLLAGIIPPMFVAALKLVSTTASLTTFKEVHVQQLTDNCTQLRLEALAAAQDGDEAAVANHEAAIGCIEAVCAALESNDVPQEILGIPVTPTFTSVLAGYAVSGVLAIISSMAFA